jgi:hypothetical protein
MLMGDQIRRAFEEWIAAECAARPVAIVVEDLHLGDIPSVRMLDGALRLDASLLVVSLARPEVDEVFPKLWEGRRITRLALGPLPRRAAEKLVQQILPGVEAAVLARIVDEAQGNAYYLEELVRAAASGTNVPGTIVAMVMTRLEGLAAEERRVLRAASVFGRSFFIDGVTALLGGAGDTRRIIEQLTTKELITGDGEERSFQHAIVREAAYASLTDQDRKLGHLIAGGWLEDREATDPLVLAEHFQRGGEPGRAIAPLVHAAGRALEGNDLAAAAERAQLAVELGATGAVRGEAYAVVAEARRWMGQSAASLEAARRAMGLTIGARWFAVAGEAAIACGALGDRETLASIGRVLADSEGASGGRCVAVARAAVHLANAGELALADRLFGIVAALADDPALAGEPQAVARAHQARAVQALGGGDPEAYLRLTELALAAFTEAGDRRNGCVQRGNVGYAQLELGAFAEAEAHLRASADEARALRLPVYEATAQHNLGLALLLLDRAAEAKATIDAALVTILAARHRRLEAAARSYLARTLVALGDAPAALVQAEAAVAIRAVGPSVRALALGTLATVCLLAAPADALTPAERAMAIVDGGDVETGEAMIRLAHIDALRAAGRHEDAERARAAAVRRLEERAGRIDPAHRARFLAIPEHARTLRP